LSLGHELEHGLGKNVGGGMPHAGQALGRRKGFEINVGFKWFGHGRSPLATNGSSPVARDYGSWLMTLGDSLHPTAQRRPAPLVRPSPPRLRTRYASETRMTAAGWWLPAPRCIRRSTLPESITHLSLKLSPLDKGKEIVPFKRSPTLPVLGHLPTSGLGWAAVRCSSANDTRNPLSSHQ